MIGKITKDNLIVMAKSALETFEFGIMLLTTIKYLLKNVKRLFERKRYQTQMVDVDVPVI